MPKKNPAKYEDAKVMGNTYRVSDPATHICDYRQSMQPATPRGSKPKGGK